MKDFTTESIEKVYKHFNSSENGLTTEEANIRLEQNGKNKLDEGKKKSLIARFFDQLKDVMIIVLIIAAVISAVIAIIEKTYADLIDSGLLDSYAFIEFFARLEEMGVEVQPTRIDSDILRNVDKLSEYINNLKN